MLIPIIIQIRAMTDKLQTLLAEQGTDGRLLYIMLAFFRAF